MAGSWALWPIRQTAQHGECRAGTPVAERGQAKATDGLQCGYSAKDEPARQK
jgi:hypothetical protein